MGRSSARLEVSENIFEHTQPGALQHLSIDPVLAVFSLVNNTFDSTEAGFLVFHGTVVASHSNNIQDVYLNTQCTCDIGELGSVYGFSEGVEKK